MFDQIIAELHKELDDLRPKLNRCYELREKTPAGETKSRLEQKYSELNQAVDRVSLSIDILSFKVSLETSEDYKIVRVP